MKKLFTILLILPLLFSAQNTFASGIEFFHGTWEEALEVAAAEEKLIFVDAYTTWCGPCKRMAANVFTQEQVGAYFNENFVNLKIDMEKPDGIQFRQKYPVSAFPTFYFIDEKGKTVHRAKGAQPADNFINLAKMVVGKVDRSLDFEKAYETGDRDPEMMYKYVKALVKSGKPSGKIANEYLNSQQDLTTEFNRQFLLAATVEADSRIFDKMIAQRAAIEAISSKAAVDDAIKKACEQTAKKAIEFNSADLHAESKSKMKKYLPEQASGFAYEADMQFYKSQGNSAKYLKTCSSYVKKKVKNNAAALHDVALDIQGGFEKDGKAMSVAEKYAKQAAENGGLSSYYTTYANILYVNKKKSEALTMAKKARDMAEGKPREQSEAIKLIRKIEREG